MGDRDQDHPQEKEMQKGKWLSEEALQIAEKRREAQGKGEKEKHTHPNVHRSTVYHSQDMEAT